MLRPLPRAVVLLIAANQSFSDHYGGLGARNSETNYGAFISNALPFSLYVDHNHGGFGHEFAGGDLLDYSVGLGCMVGNFNLGLEFAGARKSQRMKKDLCSNEPSYYVSVVTTRSLLT